MDVDGGPDSSSGLSPGFLRGVRRTGPRSKRCPLLISDSVPWNEDHSEKPSRHDFDAFCPGFYVWPVRSQISSPPSALGNVTPNKYIEARRPDWIDLPSRQIIHVLLLKISNVAAFFFTLGPDQ